VTGHELVLEVFALVIGIALMLATGLALLAAAAARLLTTAQNCSGVVLSAEAGVADSPA
jgi:hypothetical protein